MALVLNGTVATTHDFLYVINLLRLYPYQPFICMEKNKNEEICRDIVTKQILRFSDNVCEFPLEH